MGTHSLIQLLFQKFFVCSNLRLSTVGLVLASGDGEESQSQPLRQASLICEGVKS